MAEETTKSEKVARRDMAPEELPKGRAHKDTKHWCRGKDGRRHTPVIRIPANLPTWWETHPCGWYSVAANDLRLAYTCHHVEECEVCGKVLRRHYSWLPQSKLLPNEMSAQECPLYSPINGQVRVP